MAGESNGSGVEIACRTLDGQGMSLPAAALEQLRSGVRGGVLTAGEPGYDGACRIWNAMIDHRPAVIARCLSSRDVRVAVGFAREHGMLLSVRGGGHHIAGNAIADGGLTIDLSSMGDVHFDADQRTARVGGGALLGDVDHETQSFGLATPLGINSTTGFGGLCLGGGFGWLTRKYGMTIDNLIAADVVTADGELHVVSSSREPDLFWAIRGGRILTRPFSKRSIRCSRRALATTGSRATPTSCTTTRWRSSSMRRAPFPGSSVRCSWRSSAARWVVWRATRPPTPVATPTT